jgi:PAS domain S-box-containing protein
MEALGNIEKTRDLETSLSILSATLESTADGLLVVDRKQRLTLYNRRFALMWRIPPEILASGDDARAIAYVTAQVLDPAEFLAKIRELYSQPEATSFDVIRLTEGRTFERYSQPQWLGGAIAGRVWSFRDVTARVRIEEELHKRSAELQAVLDNMVEFVVACDPEGRLFLANEAARLSGVEPGQTMDALSASLEIRGPSGQTLTREELPMARALKGERVLNYDLLVDPGDGRLRSFRTNAAPIRDEGGDVVAAVSVSRDVTEELELENLKDEFVRVAAHELKTPVAVIKSCAQLALRFSRPLPPELTRTLQGLNRGADRIDRIVRSLLDLSQLLLGQIPGGLGPADLVDRLDLAELLKTARREVPHAAERIHVDVPRGTEVTGNRQRLIQVFEALLDNAIRYSPGGGEIRVRLQTSRTEAIVEIQDHGVGIAKEKQAHIFERFYRPHSGTAYDYGGMGVGLFLSREIVRRHGGRLWFQSADGVGSRFFVALPVAGARP